MLWNAFSKKESRKIVRKVITVMRPEIISLQKGQQHPQVLVGTCTDFSSVYLAYRFEIIHDDVHGQCSVSKAYDLFWLPDMAHPWPFQVNPAIVY